MNKDILIEKIKYLSSLPHSSLVEHCIYLENENDNYKAQKNITDFISENGIICEKNKEIERLNNIINELEKWLVDRISVLTISVDNKAKDEYFNNKCIGGIQELKNIKKLLKELKEGK